MIKGPGPGLCLSATTWQPFLWLLSDMANHLKRRRRGSCTVRFFIFPLQFFQKMAKRGKVTFTFLKYAKNSAYFEPRLTILRHKWTIWQSFLWLLSDMAGHLKRRQRGSCAARFFVFPLHFLQEMAKGAKLFLPFWNLQRILLILSPGWPFGGKYWPFGSHFCDCCQTWLDT